MTADTSIPNIIQLIGSVMADVTHVGKDGWNPGQKFHFRGIDAVVNAVGPALRKAGVVPTPVLETATYRDILTGSNRTPMQQCTVQVRYQFWGPAGDHLDVVVPGEAFDSGDKGTAKAMSVAYRIALLQLLALPTDEPDPDASSYERAPEVVTDPQWLADVRARIDAADSHQALQAIGGEIGARANNGGVSIADGTALQAAYDARWSALAQSAAAEPQTAQPGGTLPPPAPGVPTAKPEQINEIAGLLAAKRTPDQSTWNTIISGLLSRPIDNVQTISTAEARTVIATLSAEPDRTGPAQSAPARPETVRFATPEQLTKIRVVFNENGVRDRDEVLRAVMATVGRPIETTKQLTLAEASLVIETYQRKPGPAPAGRADAFTDLDSIIANVNDPQSYMDAADAITEELAAGRINTNDADILRERLQARVPQAVSA